MSTIFLAEISDAQKVNAIYSEFVDKDSPPARQTVAVRALPLGALVEISVIAAKS
jgi:2-iminobutanoate/2-iminopropanoate deaminase